MDRPILVHSEAELLNQFTSGAGPGAQATHSASEALKWISEPSRNITSILIEPCHPQFSALSFIDAVLKVRPSLPVFLIHDQLAMDPKSKFDLDLVGVRGAISRQDLLKIERKKSSPSTQSSLRSAAPICPYPGHRYVPISDFESGTSSLVDLYFVGIDAKSGNSEIRLFLEKKSKIDPEYLQSAAKKTEWLLMKESDIDDLRTRIRKQQIGFGERSDVPFNWRSNEVFFSANSILREIRKSGLSESLATQAHQLLGELYGLINSTANSGNADLESLIKQAARVDRTVFCASYAMLLCRRLKFEKTATLEILGFASILQDISLYHTPWGDLSTKNPATMSPEENAFYLNHPLKSADLASLDSDFSQVTLQVIRQHHERKDRSGFPNKIGGTLLHPMAEVLSLINSYYEVSQLNLGVTDTRNTIIHDVLPHYSENLGKSFIELLNGVQREQLALAKAQKI